MSWSVKSAMQLGRVSNLPTVISNTVAGAALAGGNPLNVNMLVLIFAMALAYTGGMFLNDAFDRKIDAKERPERPIPSGAIKAAEVFAAGFTLLTGAVMFAALAALSWGHNVALVITLTFVLTCTIVLYDYWHKDNPFSPFIMGLCRVLVILAAGYAATDKPSVVLYFGAVVVLCYLIGLTYAAKQENPGRIKNLQIKNLWPLLFLLVPILYGSIRSVSDYQVIPVLVLLIAWTGYSLYLIKRKLDGDIPKAVVSMIAGIALVDALLISTVSSLWVALIAVAAFSLTLYLQRYISGT